jgi:hypothetical protein
MSDELRLLIFLKLNDPLQPLQTVLTNARVAQRCVFAYLPLTPEECPFSAVVKSSELELKASLEELGIAFEVESIQMSNAIGANEAQVVR